MNLPPVGTIRTRDALCNACGEITTQWSEVLTPTEGVHFAATEWRCAFPEGCGRWAE